MTSISIENNTSSFNGIYVFFITNRLQLLYFLYVMPTVLTHPYMIWGIILVGILSQLNLILLSKWLSSEHASKGYPGFVHLFGQWMIRVFAAVGIVVIGIKVTVVTLGYVEIIHQFVFPSMNPNWLIVFVMAVCCYTSSLGMGNAIRFSVIAFLCSIWMILLFYTFFMPPIASLPDLYPLIPEDWSNISWKGLLLIWSSLSGPEYIVCIAHLLNPRGSFLKYFTFANTLSVLEYLVLFIASLFFFGSKFLSLSKFPIVTMVRYLQSPIFERVDIILICFNIFNLVFGVSIFLLCFYGALRILGKKLQTSHSKWGIQIICIIASVWLIAANKWIWREEYQSLLLNLEIWCSSLTYLLVPLFLLIFSRKKRGL